MTIGTTEFTALPVLLGSHNVERFSVDMQAHGFRGEICFTVDDSVMFESTKKDLLFTLFRSPALLTIRLAVRAKYADEEVNTAPPPVEVNGILYDRALSEHTSHRGSGDIAFPRYFVRFADPAQVLWCQHYPCALYTNASMQT